MAQIRTLVVDDEPAARERIVMLLEGDPDIEIVGECADGREAVSSIKKLAPDLLFLDIQMPELDGFKVLKRIPVEKLPVVIFITAYDKYALNAFEVNALDYLLKPFNRQRFNRAMERAKSQLQSMQVEGVDPQLLALLRDLKAQKNYLERLVVKSAGYVFFLKTEEIDWIEAADNYVRLHVGGEEHMLRETMSALEGKLDPKRFLRIQRSIIVNIERINKMHPLFRGEYILILTDGTQLQTSRGYRDKLAALMGKDT